MELNTNLPERITGVKPGEHIFNNVAWREVSGPTDNPEQLPYPTHEGTLQIGSALLRCYQLNTGQRIIDADDVCRLLGITDDN